MGQNPWNNNERERESKTLHRLFPFRRFRVDWGFWSKEHRNSRRTCSSISGLTRRIVFPFSSRPCLTQKMTQSRIPLEGGFPCYFQGILGPVSLFMIVEDYFANGNYWIALAPNILEEHKNISFWLLWTILKVYWETIWRGFFYFFSNQTTTIIDFLPVTSLLFNANFDYYYVLWIRSEQCT